MKNDKGLFGQVIPFDYGESVQRIKKAALPIKYITGEYGDGTTFSMPYSDYDTDERFQTAVFSKGVKTSQVFPESEDELKLRIAREHSLQTHRQKPHKEKQKLVSR